METKREEIYAYLRKHLGKEVTTQTIAAHFGVSRGYAALALQHPPRDLWIDKRKEAGINYYTPKKGSK